MSSMMMMTPRRRYNASRGGHAPGHLRGAFCEWVDEWEAACMEDVVSAHERAALEAGEARADQMPASAPLDGGRVTIDWLFGQLWNCRDQLAGDIRRALIRHAGDELSAAYTYAQAVRRLSAIREDR